VQFDFQWDVRKSRSNRAKHGVSFEEGATVFLDAHAASIFDVPHSDREDRWITLGLSSSGRLLVVSHTFRERADGSAFIRIISSRKATPRERRQYQE
jgi:uncharacterized DUF497 family protein